MDFNFDDEIILENERALIRPLLITDFESLLPVATADKTLLQFSPTPNYTPELLDGYIQKALEERKIKFRYPLLIFDKEKKLVAGSSSFANVSNIDQRLEIGWTWIGRELQQTGLNRNCKFLMLQFAFEKLNFVRVEFRIDERNTASRNAIEKIGGKLEGILRSHILMPDGFRRSTCYYSLLKEEWPEIKEQLISSRHSKGDKYFTRESPRL